MWTNQHNYAHTEFLYTYIPTYPFIFLYAIVLYM
jgi:hypothetical protein